MKFKFNFYIYYDHIQWHYLVLPDMGSREPNVPLNKSIILK